MRQNLASANRRLALRENRYAESRAQDLSALAVSALLDEAELTPKPALVDRRGSGAHHDLSLMCLRRSAESLGEGFADMARAGSMGVPLHLLREELGRLGRGMERRMMDATGGSNAHRGAIWTLGLLVAAASRLPWEREAARIAAAAGALARLPDGCAPQSRAGNGSRLLTHGQEAWLRYGATGARGEAVASFPHVVRVGLPMLHAARRRGPSEDCARLNALMAIMSTLDDTCLIHRGGGSAVEAAKTGARAVLAAGGPASPTGLQGLHCLHSRLMGLWASPGGSADLLAATLFLDRLGA